MIKTITIIFAAAAAIACLILSGITAPTRAQSTWTASWSDSALTPGNSSILSVLTSEDAADDDRVAVTLHVGRDESTADTGDIVVVDRHGDAISPIDIERRVDHNGGWVYLAGAPTVGEAKDSVLAVRAVQDDDGSDEKLAVWVYVNGGLAGASTLTISAAPRPIEIQFEETAYQAEENSSVSITVTANQTTAAPARYRSA